MTDGYIEKSLKADSGDLEKIRQYTRTDFDESELYIFSLVLCSNDIDRDHEKFSLSALRQMAELFRGKTGIADHSMKSADQKARIFDTWVEKQPGRRTADGEDLWMLKAKAYTVRNAENASFITDIDAGIKKEVSVSCSVAQSVCSICRQDKKAGSCRHIPGSVYDGKQAYFLLSGVKDAYEWSFVAVPAQRDAGVTKSFYNQKGENAVEEVVKIIKSCDDFVTLSKSEANSVCRYIASLEEDADLGKTYKEELVREVMTLCAFALPHMDMKIFEGVAKVMTAKELQCFKNVFSKSAGNDTALPQLKAEKTHKNNDFSSFKI